MQNLVSDKKVLKTTNSVFPSIKEGIRGVVGGTVEVSCLPSFLFLTGFFSSHPGYPKSVKLEGMRPEM